MQLRYIYSFLVWISSGILSVVALFSPKIKLFRQGRKNVFNQMERALGGKENVIWMHVASLGEYEQGLPVLEKLKTEYPRHTFLLTFFSPSGYEVKKNSTWADLVFYLPLDTLQNATRFIGIAKPKLAIFIKYEIWPNYLYTLKKNGIPTLMVSGMFYPKQVFFKPWGAFMRKSLKTFHHFFVQNETSKKLLNQIGLESVTVNGDTRFDRVAAILDGDNHLDFMDTFKQDTLCIVAGSTWPEDIAVLLPFLNQYEGDVKWVIAPHTIKPEAIEKLQVQIKKPTVTYSKMNGKDVSKADVLIVDTIGLLTKIYSYANIAYVGGGFATGLHNTLEPAVFGIPVLIGPRYKGFNEAETLVQAKGIISIASKEELEEILLKLLKNPGFQKETGQINTNLLQSSKGATEEVIRYVKTIL
ncbi:MAG: glycosyltransferase N-terminal domain-containing protein [Bacteroidota bacterium]